MGFNTRRENIGIFGGNDDEEETPAWDPSNPFGAQQPAAPVQHRPLVAPPIKRGGGVMPFDPSNQGPQPPSPVDPTYFQQQSDIWQQGDKNSVPQPSPSEVKGMNMLPNPSTQYGDGPNAKAYADYMKKKQSKIPDDWEYMPSDEEQAAYALSEAQFEDKYPGNMLLRRPPWAKKEDIFNRRSPKWIRTGGENVPDISAARKKGITPKPYHLRNRILD